MLTLSDLKVGIFFVMEDDPWQVLDAKFVKMAQRTGHLEAKIRNLRTGIVLTRSFKQADKFGEADLSHIRANFVFSHREKYVFAEAGNPKQRIELSQEHVGDTKFYLTPNLTVDILRFEDAILGIQLPPKVDLRVTEAPPWAKGDTATGGTKTVMTESGLSVRTPHFIETGATIKVNTKTGEYVGRVEK